MIIKTIYVLFIVVHGLELPDTLLSQIKRSGDFDDFKIVMKKMQKKVVDVPQNKTQLPDKNITKETKTLKQIAEEQLQEFLTYEPKKPEIGGRVFANEDKLLLAIKEMEDDSQIEALEFIYKKNQIDQARMERLLKMIENREISITKKQVQKLSKKYQISNIFDQLVSEIESEQEVEQETQQEIESEVESEKVESEPLESDDDEQVIQEISQGDETEQIVDDQDEITQEIEFKMDDLDESIQENIKIENDESLFDDDEQNDLDKLLYDQELVDQNKSDDDLDDFSFIESLVQESIEQQSNIDIEQKAQIDYNQLLVEDFDNESKQDFPEEEDQIDDTPKIIDLVDDYLKPDNQINELVEPTQDVKKDDQMQQTYQETKQLQQENQEISELQKEILLIEPSELQIQFNVSNMEQFMILEQQESNQTNSINQPQFNQQNPNNILNETQNFTESQLFNDLQIVNDQEQQLQQNYDNYSEFQQQMINDSLQTQTNISQEPSQQIEIEKLPQDNNFVNLSQVNVTEEVEKYIEEIVDYKEPEKELIDDVIQPQTQIHEEKKKKSISKTSKTIIQEISLNEQYQETKTEPSLIQKEKAPQPLDNKLKQLLNDEFNVVLFQVGQGVEENAGIQKRKKDSHKGISPPKYKTPLQHSFIQEDQLEEVKYEEDKIEFKEDEPQQDQPQQERNPKISDEDVENLDNAFDNPHNQDPQVKKKARYAKRYPAKSVEDDNNKIDHRVRLPPPEDDIFIISALTSSKKNNVQKLQDFEQPEDDHWVSNKQDQDEQDQDQYQENVDQEQIDDIPQQNDDEDNEAKEKDQSEIQDELGDDQQNQDEQQQQLDKEANIDEQEQEQEQEKEQDHEHNENENENEDHQSSHPKIFFNSFAQNMSVKKFNCKDRYYGAQQEARNFICSCSQQFYQLDEETWYLAGVIEHYKQYEDIFEKIKKTIPLTYTGLSDKQACWATQTSQPIIMNEFLNSLGYKVQMQNKFIQLPKLVQLEYFQLSFQDGQFKDFKLTVVSDDEQVLKMGINFFMIKAELASDGLFVTYQGTFQVNKQQLPFTLTNKYGDYREDIMIIKVILPQDELMCLQLCQQVLNEDIANQLKIIENYCQSSHFLKQF